jgi:hypothetical protein
MAFNRRSLVAIGAGVALLAGGVLVAASSRSSHQFRAGAAIRATTAPPTPTSTVGVAEPATSAATPGPPSADLVAAFPALAGAKLITDSARLTELARLRAEFERARPGSRFDAPVGWTLRTAGDAEYAVVSFGPERLCLVGFRAGAAQISGPACATAAVAEAPATPLVIYGPVDGKTFGIVALMPAGVDAVTLRTRGGTFPAEVAKAIGYAASGRPPVSLTVTTADGHKARTPLAADSGSAAAFYLSIQESVRRELLSGEAWALGEALANVAASGGVSVDYLQDRFVRVGVDSTASVQEQAAVAVIVRRFPKLAGDVELVPMTTSTNDLLQLMDEVQRAWANLPGFVSIGIGVGIIDIEHLPGSTLPPAVQAIIDQHPQLFHVTEGGPIVAD